MNHLLLLASGGDLFSMGKNLVTKLAALGGEALILVVAVICLGHVVNHRGAAVVGVILLALIPAWLFFDPTGATHTIKSTVSGL